MSPDTKRIPRPQQALRSFDLMLGCLVLLTLTFFFLTLYNILQANPLLLPETATKLLSLKIMDTSTSASLFVTLMGALLVRHQFALGLQPRINYKSENAVRKDTSQPDTSLVTWRVELRNSGLGAAIVNSANLMLEFTDEKLGNHTGNYRDIVRELTGIGLTQGQDYWLENITAGFALSPKDDCFLFEIKTEHLTKIKRLDMTIYFQNQLGGRYVREVWLVPHGIPSPNKQGSLALKRHSP